jgi:hypothetical protein
LGWWRKAEDWRRKLKGQMRRVSRVSQGGGRDKERRVQAAAKEYVVSSYVFENKVVASIMG